MRVAALVLLLATAAVSRDERQVLMLRDWVAAVEAHVAGEHDAALSRIAAWTYDDLDRVRPYVEALVQAPDEHNRDRRVRAYRLARGDRAAIADLTQTRVLRGDFDGFRKRAVILHTDTAILGARPVVVEAPRRLTPQSRSRELPEHRVDVKSADGVVELFQLANPHWEIARDILDALAVPATRDPIVPQWYRTIGAYFARQRANADAIRHFEIARAIVPDHPDVLYGEACLEEMLGAPRVQDYVRLTVLPNGLTIRGVFAPEQHHRRAEGLLRRTLAVAPDFPEANLRLGRVLTQQRRAADAMPFLTRALEASPDRALRYYAYLFTGDAHQALDDLTRARQSYEHALEMFPTAQAARLSLAMVHRLLGNGPTALETILPAIGPEARDTDDPWWSYYDGDAAQVDRLLEALRAPFKEPR